MTEVSSDIARMVGLSVRPGAKISAERFLGGIAIAGLEDVR